MTHIKKHHEQLKIGGKMNNKQKVDDIISKYSNKYQFISTPDIQSFALSEQGIIVINLSSWVTPNSFFVFAVLHEIGHCETYKRKQNKITREFLATQWAINNSKQWNVKITNKQKQDWQEYIYSFSKAKDKQTKYLLNWESMN